MDTATLAYHELRAPLGLIATTAHWAAAECPDRETRDRVEAIARVAEQLLNSATQVLGLGAQASLHDERLAYSPAGVAARVFGAMESLGWRVEVVDDPGPAALGDPSSFEALLQSLANNCLDHGDPAAPVKITVERLAATVRVSVANRATAVRRHDGHGLGQYIARELAHAAGASGIAYESNADGWFSTVIDLPATNPE